MRNTPTIIVDAAAFRARQAYLDVKVADLAAQAHSSVATVVKLRKGNPTVNLEAAARIAAGLGLRVRVSFEPIEQEKDLSSAA